MGHQRPASPPYIQTNSTHPHQLLNKPVRQTTTYALYLLLAGCHKARGQLTSMLAASPPVPGSSDAAATVRDAGWDECSGRWRSRLAARLAAAPAAMKAWDSAALGRRRQAWRRGGGGVGGSACAMYGPDRARRPAVKAHGAHCRLSSAPRTGRVAQRQAPTTK